MWFKMWFIGRDLFNSPSTRIRLTNNFYYKNVSWIGSPRVRTRTHNTQKKKSENLFIFFSLNSFCMITLRRLLLRVFLFIYFIFLSFLFLCHDNTQSGIAAWNIETIRFQHSIDELKSSMLFHMIGGVNLFFLLLRTHNSFFVFIFFLFSAFINETTIYFV